MTARTLVAPRQATSGYCRTSVDHPQRKALLLAELDVHMNVSLDGFAADSHGVFRGRREGFAETVKRFARAGILQGLLRTPNNLAEDEEYAELCVFAREQGAWYVLPGLTAGERLVVVRETPSATGSARASRWTRRGS